MAVILNGTNETVSLDFGYSLRAPGLQGEAELLAPRPATARARSRSDADGTVELDAALEATDVAEVRLIELRVTPASTVAGAARSIESLDGSPVFELQVPDLGPETGQVVLACDEAGILTWHLPVDEGQRVQSPATRGAGGTKRFLIPGTVPSTGPPPGAGQRSIVGAVGRKVLKILVYPMADAVLGPVSEHFAEAWERRHRPYGIRTFAPADRTSSTGQPIGEADWSRLAAGRALLFIHGTFSTAHAAFSQIPNDDFRLLYERYGGRVFAFNHFTLSHDPQQNADWFLAQLPHQHKLDVDIVCHSRGGLVARQLAERTSDPADSAPMAIGRIVFVGVPNHGTVLAHPDHVVKMIDRLTSALNLFPTGPVTETLEALITALKVIGHSALTGLPGLSSMHPTGAFLTALNSGSPNATQYYAIAADFEPTDEGLRALVCGSVADAVIDRVFENMANDLVVPELGVYGANGSLAFPIPNDRVLMIPAEAGIVHTTIFGYSETATRLKRWLV